MWWCCCMGMGSMLQRSWLTSTRRWFGARRKRCSISHDERLRGLLKAVCRCISLWATAFDDIREPGLGLRLTEFHSGYRAIHPRATADCDGKDDQ